MKSTTKILFLIFTFWIVLHSNHSFARPFIADISPRKIGIDHNFKGVNILVYGARNDAGNIVVVVRGPKKNAIVRKKGKILGVWTNRYNIKVADFSTFYAITSLQPISKIENKTLLENLEVGKNRINFNITTQGISSEKSKEFKSATISLMQQNGLINRKNSDFIFFSDTLFKTFIEFPKNIAKGNYSIDIYLFNDGSLQSYQSLPLIIEKVGFEAYTFNAAHKYPALYGICAVIMAFAIGLLINLIMRR